MTKPLCPRLNREYLKINYKNYSYEPIKGKCSGDVYENGVLTEQGRRWYFGDEDGGNGDWFEIYYDASGDVNYVKLWHEDADPDKSTYYYLIPGYGWYDFYEIYSERMGAPTGYEDVTEEFFASIVPFTIGCEHESVTPAT